MWAFDCNKSRWSIYSSVVSVMRFVTRWLKISLRGFAIPQLFTHINFDNERRKESIRILTIISDWIVVCRL